MMAAAKRSVLLADASKFERISVSQTTDWNRIDCLVTDLPGNAPATQALQSKGVQVFSVSV